MCKDYCDGISCKDYLGCDQIRWKPYPETKPLENYKNQKVIGEYLVTLELINKDKNDDNEVTVATWDCKDQSWRYLLDHTCKYGEHGWKVIAWMIKPYPYIKTK